MPAFRPTPVTIRARSWLLALLLAATGCPAAFPAPTVTVEVDRPGARINPAMWGVFFEDINLGADGGLYAELVKNRSFDFPEALTGWSVPAGSASSTQLGVLEEPRQAGAAGHYLNLVSAGQGAVLENEGFRGIGTASGETLNFSAIIRGKAPLGLRAELVAPSGEVIASVPCPPWGREWTEVKAVLTATGTEAHCRLRLAFAGPGSAQVRRVSLFPAKTWKGRQGGLREDMVQALADLGPGFVRFPGGCIVEGNELDQRYQWKETIGPLEERPLKFNKWSTAMKRRQTPDYFQSFGLGFFEYFVLCEDLGAQALPILNCGMACQFSSGELSPLDQMDTYVQDALDLVEFANGPETSEWGARRAAMGHPQPFNMTMLGVGNEQWGPHYMERYALFSQAFRARHPEIALVGAAGPSPDDPRFIYAWQQMRAMRADFIDEHCYAKPEWFLDHSRRYDTYDRAGPKVFMGEYAAQSVEVGSPDNRNTWGCALAEAAYMTGMERNADVVRMASYAPLFAHVEGWQWTPDLIWVDNLRTLLTPSYHVQRLFARNRGDRILPAVLDGATPQEARRVYVSAVRDDASGDVVVKLVNALPNQTALALRLKGVSPASRATRIVLGSDSLEAVNTFDSPRTVFPRESQLGVGGADIPLTLASYSLTLLRIGTAR